MARRARTVTTPAYTAYNVTSPPQGDLDSLRTWAAGELARVEQAIPRSSVTAITANYTALPSDRMIIADATDAAITVTLPDPVRVKFMRVTIKRTNAGSNQITIGGTIDGAVDPTLTTQYAAISLVSDGTQWLVDGVATDILGGIDPAASPDPQPTTQTDEFNLVTLNSKWSWLNQGTSSVAFYKGRLLMTAQCSGNAAFPEVRALVQSITGSWAIRTKVAFYTNVAGSGGGLIALRSSNGRFVSHIAYRRTVIASGMFTAKVDTSDFADYNSQNASLFLQNADSVWGQYYLQLRCDGTNIYWDASVDNVQYFNLGSYTAASYLGGVPDRIGILGQSPHATTDGLVAFDWFRLYANSNLNQT